MKTFKDIISEVLEPRSEGERAFKGLHNPINHKNLVPGVTDQEHLFTGDKQRQDPLTASYHGTDDVEAYDKGMKIDPKRNQFGGKGTASMATAGLEEKKLTPAEMKKREEVAKAIARENPNMPMGKKMAIATATAKKVAENYDEMDYEGEMARSELAAICDKSEKLMNMMSDDMQLEAWLQSKITKAKYMIDSVYDYLVYRQVPQTTSYDSMMNRMESVEQIDELSKKTKDRYLKRSMDSFQSAWAHRRNAQSTGDKETEDKMRKVMQKRNSGMTRVYGEETEIAEARRGRPRKDGTKPEGDEDGGREHIVMQLRKAVSLRGEKHVEFNDNSKHQISVDHAKKALAMHDNMKRAEDKQNFAARLAKSHGSFKDAIAGKPAEKAKPKISLGGSMKEAKVVNANSQDIDPGGMADVNTLASDRGDIKTYTTIGPDGRMKIVKHREHRKQIKVESADMDKDNVEKMVKHDCAKHVVHKEWGNGETVEGQHTIVETSEHEGYVTHYDVMFDHGIERNVPVEDLTIVTMVEHWHKNYKPKSMREQTAPKTDKEKKLAALAEPRDKITHKDVLVGRGVFKKKSMRESVSVNMAADSIAKIEKDPLASKVKIKLPPTQGNEPVGGEGEIAGGLGKSSVTEQALIDLYNSLSDDNKAMFESMIETEDGFNKLVEFAEKQGLI